MCKEVLKPKHIALALPYTIFRSIEDRLRNLDVDIVAEAYFWYKKREKANTISYECSRLIGCESR